MRRTRSTARLLFGLPLLAVLACRTLVEPGAPRPLPAGDRRGEALVAALAATGAERSALRATARVSVEGQHGGSFARQILLLERPARLRLEVLGVLGQRVAVLASDGIHYDLYRAERPAIESGDVHPGILFEVAGLALTPEEAVRLALGAPIAPDEGRPSVAGAAALVDGVRVELGYRAGDPRRTLEFDASGALSRYAVRDAASGLVLDARYGDYRPLGGGRFAYRVQVSLPAATTRAEIEFQTVELNPKLPNELFRLPQRAPEARARWRPNAS